MKYILFSLLLATSLTFPAYSQVNAAAQPEAAEDDVLRVDTEMLNVSLTPIPTKAEIVWQVTRNGVEEKDFSFSSNTGKVELTVIIEDVDKKRGLRSSLVGQNLKNLGKNRAVGEVKVYGIGSRRDDFAVRWDKDWNTSFFDSFDRAVETFWKGAVAGKRRALLIISNRTEALPSDIFARLKNESGLKSALVYYLAMKPVKRNEKWVLSWCNLNWQYKWAVTLNEQYVGKQFSSFEDMIANYRVMNLYLDEAGRTEVTVVGREAGTGKKLVEQTRIYERREESK